MIALLTLLYLPTAAQAADMSFGEIVYVAGGGTMTATMSVVDGSLACTQASYYTCPAFGTRGSDLITGTTGSQVQIRCKATGKISNNITVLAVQAAQVRIRSTTGTCNGLNNTIITHTISGIQANNTLYMAARLRVPGNTTSLEGTYSATNAGGEPMQIRLIFI